jgi:hypothetical protein
MWIPWKLIVLSQVVLTGETISNRRVTPVTRLAATIRIGLGSLLFQTWMKSGNQRSEKLSVTAIIDT